MAAFPTATLPGAYVERYRLVRAGFIARGTSFNAWCIAAGVKRQNAAGALLGKAGGRRRGRRGQGMNGRSCLGAFEAGLSERVRRTATTRQLWLASLVYTPVTPDRWGRVTVDGWTYGGPETQEALLPCHTRRERVLPGRNPDDFAAPAPAWNAEDRLICDGIEPQRRGCLRQR